MPPESALVAPTSTGWTEVLSAYLYDWNQDGSARLRGSTFVADAEGKPRVGERVVLYGDGLAVPTTVTRVERAQADGGWFIDTTWNQQVAGSVRNAT